MLIAYKGGDLDAELSRARIKAGLRDAEAITLAFPGSADSGLVDKKIIVIRVFP